MDTTTMDTSEEDAPQTTQLRLGKCEVCNSSEAKYTCPKCEVKTCCLKCLNIHKKELECDGLRDKTKFIPLKKLTKYDLLSDYNFLEECTNYVNVKKSHNHFQGNKLPSRLYQLQQEASKRKINLRFLSKNFTKRNRNTTFYERKNNVILWRIDWIFSNANNLLLTEEKCLETDLLFDLFNKLVSKSTSSDASKAEKTLIYYLSKDVSNIKLLLKAEQVKNCKNRVYELNMNKTLKENLANKVIIEYPTIYAVYDELYHNFEIIDPENDIEMETKLYTESYRTHDDAGVPIVNNDDTMEAEMKKLKIKKIKEAQSTLPQNYLFTNENLPTDDDTDESD